MILEALRKVVDGVDLTHQEAAAVMREIMDGEATAVQIGGLAAAMRTKKETAEELAGFASVMRERAIRVTPRRRPLLDMCGTGGDYAGTFNVSTAAMLVVAAAGIPVAKHGNRGVSSQCGSADVLAALGVELDLTPEEIARCIDTVGIGFIYAPSHHPALRNASQPRRELGIRTFFNVLGPMTNPAGATHQLIGVFDPDLCPKVAEALNRMGGERVMVVHGMDGLDEISTVGPTRMSILQNGRVSTDLRTPAEFFVVPARMEELRGGATPEENAQILISVLQGEPGPRRDFVAVNAAAGLILGGMAEGWRDGVALATRMITTGRALQVLSDLVTFTRQFTKEPAEAPA